MQKVNAPLEEIASKTDFEATYQRTYMAKKPLQFLEQQGIFPLTAKNPKLIYLNVLGLYAYLSGHLGNKNQNYNATISCNGLNIPKSDLEYQLGLKLVEKKKCLLFGKNGATYARLLYAMGFYTSSGGKTRSTKAKTGSRLPPYLENFIINYNGLSRELKKLAKPLLRDLLSVWFDAKGDVPSNRVIRVDTLSQPTPEKAKEQARIFLSAVNHLYPSVDAPSCEIRTNENKLLRSYISRVTFSIDQLLQFPSSGGSPVEIHARIKPNFAFNLVRKKNNSF